MPVLARLRDAGELDLVAVCDIQRERSTAAKRKFGFDAETGDAVSALGRLGVDVVYVFGSAPMHFEYGLAALGGGRHLFVEKPIAPSYVQASQLAWLAKERGLIAAGGHNRRFYASLAAVRARAGRTQWRSVEAAFHKPEFGNPPAFGARTWLTANGIHALDALVYMMGGLPERVTSFAARNGRVTPGTFSALMRWASGAQGVFLCNNEAGARREEYVFHGPGETYRVDAEGVAIEKDGRLEKLPMPALGDGIQEEHQAFLAAIREACPLPHSLDALAPSLLLAELIESGFDGPVLRPEVDRDEAPRHRPHRASILVAKADSLQAALADLSICYRLVSAEDVRDLPEPRPDIVAAILGPRAPPLSGEMLDKLPSLTIVGVAALSLSRYAPDELLARGITLVNATHAYAESVAEFALGLAILGRRRAFALHEVMRAGGWGSASRRRGLWGVLRRAARLARPTLDTLGVSSLLLPFWRASASGAGNRAPVSRDLRGAVVGLIGWGANARAFTRRLIQSQARVLVFSRRALPAEIHEAGAVPVSLAEVLAADIVSLHRGLTASTRHCLGTGELDRLRPGTVLINVARGALIEPAALIARLRRGDIFACLDTYEEEPLPSSHPLRRMPNVFLTPHIAGGSVDMHAAAVDEIVRKVAAHLEGRGVEAISAERLLVMT